MAKEVSEVHICPACGRKTLSYNMQRKLLICSSCGCTKRLQS